MTASNLTPFKLGNKANGKGSRTAGGRVRQATNELSARTLDVVTDIVTDVTQPIAVTIAARGLLEACSTGLSGWRNRMSVVEQTDGKAISRVQIEQTHVVTASDRLATLMSRCGVQADAAPALEQQPPIVAEVLGERGKGEGGPGDSGVPLGPHTGVPAVLYAEATDGIDADEETGPDEDSLHE